MPVDTIHSALLEMYFDDPGAPWKFPKWPTLTGTNGVLFAEDDSQLPKGWNQKTSQYIRSYIDQYKKEKTQEQMIPFAARKGASEVPGRELWRKFVTDLWKTHQLSHYHLD